MFSVIRAEFQHCTTIIVCLRREFSVHDCKIVLQQLALAGMDLRFLNSIPQVKLKQLIIKAGMIFIG